MDNAAAITRFRGKYAFLSNFYPAEVWFEGAVYPSVEHAYQAAKTTDLLLRRAFQSAAPFPWTASRAKTQGRRLKLRPDWETVKLDVMRQCLLSKFRLNSVLRAQLIFTGDSPLVEENTWGDRFWGVYRGEGENWLGRLLMETREAIQIFRVELPATLVGGTPEEEAKRFVAWLAFDPRTDWARLYVTLPARLKGGAFLRAFFIAVGEEAPAHVPLLRKARWVFAGMGEDAFAAQEINSYVDAYFGSSPHQPVAES